MTSLPPVPSPIGPTLRRLRTDREVSLATVADQAGISVATLSRIETNKQGIDVSLLLTLARVLGVAAADILGSADDRDDLESLSSRLAALPADARTEVFLQSGRRRKARGLQPVLDDLVSAIEVMRDELVSVQRTMRKRDKR